MRKSKFAATLKGPPAVREWPTMDPGKDGSPCVIKRRFQYWQTNLNKLSAAEKALQGYLDGPGEKHQVDIEALQLRIENRKSWVRFSADTLRNSIRFARARINPDSEDYELLMNICPKCGIDTRHELNVVHDEATHFVSVSLQSGKSELRCMSCYQAEPYAKARLGVTRKPRGRLNRKFHKELRYYDNVLDSFFCAKKAAAGNSMSDAAINELMAMAGSTISHFKFKTAREAEDAEQQGMVGLLEAARKFDPTASNLAKFTTYASFWIRRRAQARKTSHCRPGVAIVKGKHKTTSSIQNSDRDEGHADRFHPGAKVIDHDLKLDVQAALGALSKLSRQIMIDRLIHKEPLRDIASKYSLPVTKVRLIIDGGTAHLAEALADHAL